jgi:hypothetical protein
VRIPNVFCYGSFGRLLYVISGSTAFSRCTRNGSMNLNLVHSHTSILIDHRVVPPAMLPPVFLQIYFTVTRSRKLVRQKQKLERPVNI